MYDRMRYLVKCALRDGRLIRPDYCSQCKKLRLVVAHHDDYAKPLDVRWLCRSCHQNWHEMNREGLNYHLAELSSVRSANHIDQDLKGNDERYRCMIELAKLGKSLREISREFKVSRERVRQIIGNPRRFHYWPCDRYGFASIKDADGNILGEEVVSLMTIEEIKGKYPNAKMPTGMTPCSFLQT
jgi:transposase-like protein